MGSSFRLQLLTAAGLALLALPAAAQFNPPRPPGAVPNRGPAPPPPQAMPPGPPPLNMQDAMPPDETDDDAVAAQPPPPPVRGGQAATRGGPPPVQMPGAPAIIRGQQLAPPPGSTATAPGAGPTIPPPVGQPGAAGAGQMKPPTPANTAPQPGDEVVVEMPAVKIQNPTAVFAGLDKITGRIIAFDVKINETVQFGALKVTPRMCYTRPTTEAAHTNGFVDVDEVTLQGEVKRLFTGWMFAGSPGLHAVEHPIYDIWLTNCKGGTTVVADTQPNAPGPTQPAPAGSAKPSATQQRQQQGAGVPPAGATAAGPGAQQQQPRPQAQRQPGTMQVPDGMQPLPPPPGSQPVQWPPRR